MSEQPTPLDPARAEALAAEWEPLGAEEVLARAVELFHPQLVTACSFQKEESVLCDLLFALRRDARVFTIDTGALFEETREAWHAFERRWSTRVEPYLALPPEGEQWSASRCCSDAKVAALGRAVAGERAWVTGLRREQAPTRAEIHKLEWDEQRGLWKVNPLADWTERQLWERIGERELPYHPLHDGGYASIGCAPCTQPGSGREGRWAEEDKTECGLHVEGAPRRAEPEGERPPLTVLRAGGAR